MQPDSEPMGETSCDGGILEVVLGRGESCVLGGRVGMPSGVEEPTLAFVDESTEKRLAPDTQQPVRGLQPRSEHVFSYLLE